MYDNPEMCFNYLMNEKTQLRDILTASLLKTMARHGHKEGDRKPIDIRLGEKGDEEREKQNKIWIGS